MSKTATATARKPESQAPPADLPMNGTTDTDERWTYTDERRKRLQSGLRRVREDAMSAPVGVV